MKPALIAAALAMAATTLPAFADPPHGRGHGRWEHKEEYRDGDCKIERKWGKHGDYKEEVKCKGYRPAPMVAYQQPPVMVRRAPQVLVPAQGGSMLSCNRDIVGGLLGGATGGVLGSQIGKGTGKVVATAAGTLAGVLIGGSIGRSMDEADQYCAAQAFEQARPNQVVAWQNPDGAAYQVQPARQFQDHSGRYCREFTSKVTIGGRPQQAYGTACRQPDGDWEIVG